MKLGAIMNLPILLVALCLLPDPARAEGEAKKQPSEPSRAADADATAEAQKAARDALAKFEKEWRHSDRKGTWKVRMACLVALAKAGDGAGPVLDDTLKSGPPSTRAFAAQALRIITDPSARRALLDYDLTRMGSAREGKAAPDFALADTQDKTWRLSQFRGKKSVVLVFLMGED